MSHQSILDRLNELEKERAVADRAALQAVADQYKPLRDEMKAECAALGHIFSTDYFDEDGEPRHCVICGAVEGE